MPKFRKKPVVIEAIQFDGQNHAAIKEFMAAPHARSRGEQLYISTLEGVMTASAGDWIIRGVSGEFYPCKPDVFTATYEPAE